MVDEYKKVSQVRLKKEAKENNTDRHKKNRVKKSSRNQNEIKDGSTERQNKTRDSSRNQPLSTGREGKT